MTTTRFTNEGSVIVLATIKDGLGTGIDFEKQFIIEASCNHVWNEWSVTIPATTTSEGVETRTCTVCNENETRPIGIVTNAPELSTANTLRAWMRNGLLHVTGLTAGETLSIYNATGVLVYHSIATGKETDISLNVQGMYIVIAGERTVRVVFN